MRSEKAASLTAVCPAGFKLRLPALALGHVWVVCALALVLGYVCTPTSFALDLWQHLSLGREMVLSHHLISTEAYAHTLAGQVRPNQNWLAQIILYLCYHAGGREGVTLFVAGLYTLAFGAIMHICWTRCRHTRVAVGCTLLAAAIACENLSVRTQVFSALCLSLELLVLWTNALKRWRPLAVALIVLLWTNTHGAFALGVALPVLFAVGRAVRVWRQRTHGLEFRVQGSGFSGRLALAALIGDAELRTLVLTIGCAGAAAFCNPHPGRTIEYVFENMGAGLRRNIQEWQPVPFASITGKFFFGSLALLPLVLSWSRRRIEATEAILLVAFICLGAKAWRMSMWYGFVLAPVLAAHLATLLPPEACSDGRQVKTCSTGSRPPNSPGKETVLNYAFLFMLLTMTGLCLPWFKAYNPLLPPARRATVPPDEPIGMASFLDGHGASGNAFNPMEWGGYLMWQFDGRLKVFVDGRIDPFSDTVWSDYEAIAAGRADWADLLEQYHVTTLIADRRKMPVLVRVAGASPRWKQVYADGLAVVFEKN